MTFLLINVLVALAQDLDPDGATVTNCGADEETYEECETVGKATFLAVLKDVAVSGIPGMSAGFNAIYVTVSAILLLAGVLLIVLAFVPTLGN